MKTTKIKNILDNGYTIYLPFKLNKQQKEVIKQIDDFINNPDEFVMTVSGWAGTGKTTLMEIVSQRYWMGHYIHFAATTHKAAGVLKEKVHKKVSTVNSLFGIMIETDMDNDIFDVTNKKRSYSDDKVRKDSIIIIDEASMLSVQNYVDVLKKCAEYHCKIIFIGDSAQLSPVNEDDISIVFRNDKCRVVELTKVERTDDNSILDEATGIRTGSGFSYQTHMNDSGEGVEYVSPTDVKSIMNIIDSKIDGLKENPNYFRILSYTNANVEKLNQMVRKKLGYNDDIPHVGEPLMSYTNWGYEGTSSTGAIYKIINSESYTCKEVINEYDENIRDMITYDVTNIDDFNLHIVDLCLVNANGDEILVPYIEVKNNEKNRKLVIALSLEKVHQWNLYRNSDSKASKFNALQKINAIDEFLFINDNVKDQYDNIIQAKVIDYGYAHTIHKSQGSTFEHVLINDNDINKCLNEKNKKQLRYVALTRAQKSVSIITSQI